MSDRIDVIREDLIVNRDSTYFDVDELSSLLDEYEALVELRALQNIVGIKVGPVE